MIESILLPEPSGLTKRPVDLMRREMLPGLTLFQHRFFICERSQQMNMIRHNDELSEFVPIAVEFMKALRDDLRQHWLTENALAVTGVQIIVPFFGEAVLDVVLNNLRQF